MQHFLYFLLDPQQHYWLEYLDLFLLQLSAISWMHSSSSDDCILLVGYGSSSLDFPLSIWSIPSELNVPGSFQNPSLKTLQADFSPAFLVPRLVNMKQNAESITQSCQTLYLKETKKRTSQITAFTRNLVETRAMEFQLLIVISQNRLSLIKHFVFNKERILIKLIYLIVRMESQPLFSESDKYKPQAGGVKGEKAPNDIQGIEEKLWKHVEAHAKQNDPVSVYQEIDNFCRENWMMNLGPEKGVIVRDQFQEIKPKTVLEIGTYCGYSSVFFSTLIVPQAKIYTLEVNQNTIQVARKIFAWAGLENKVIQLKGNIQQNIEEVKKIAPLDVIFLDHWKNVYLKDFKFLEENGLISKGTVVIADNVICPGVPDYIQHLKASDQYVSVLYHSQLEYSPHIPDAVLVSKKL